MSLPEGFWEGTGGALIGSFLAAVVAIGTIFLTRRHDRALLREQVGLDAAARLLRQGIYVANVLAAQVHGENAVSYSDWLQSYLEQSVKFRHEVLMDAPAIPERLSRVS